MECFIEGHPKYLFSKLLHLVYVTHTPSCLSVFLSVSLPHDEAEGLGHQQHREFLAACAFIQGSNLA